MLTLEVHAAIGRAWSVDGLSRPEVGRRAQVLAAPRRPAKPQDSVFGAALRPTVQLQVLLLRRGAGL